MKAAIYARVSTGKQAEKDLSIPDQVQQLIDYCRNKGWTVRKTYVELGASARDDKRPVFQEMMGDALGKDHPFDVILTLTTSRFFRERTAAQVYKKKLAKKGIKVIAIHQEVPEHPSGILTEGLFELIDEWESNINGLHTLRAMKENARRGYFNGSRPKFGFQVVSKDV